MLTGCNGATETLNPVMTFSSSGNKKTSEFTVNSSSWILQYSTSYNGRISIKLMPFVDIMVVDNDEVVKSKVYQIEMEGHTGYPLHFKVVTHHGNPGWTIEVFEN
jgi:heme-binding NEAT domain protein